MSEVSLHYPDDLRELVERHLEGLHFGRSRETAGLGEAMRYSLLAGGKRVRPVLALATARALGESPESVLPLAAAVELIHTYSLIHDDLPAMDDDDMRRGRPTCHVAYGEHVAILAGDALYAEAFAHLLGQQLGSPTQVLATAAELAAATGVEGMVGGQYLDVLDITPQGPEGLRILHSLKTGRLIESAILCVLILNDVPESATIGYRTFAQELGVLFQIVDDILDVTGEESDLGKPRGSDARHGKRTYVSEFGIDRAHMLAADSHTRARDALAVAAPQGAPDLEAITDFIYTRTS